MKKVKISKYNYLTITDGDGCGHVMRCWRMDEGCSTTCAAFHFDGRIVCCRALPKDEDINRIAIIDNEDKLPEQTDDNK